MTYENLKRKTQQLQSEGKVSSKLTRAQVADWAYGNAAIENDRVTRGMAERAAIELVKDD